MRFPASARRWPLAGLAVVILLLAVLGAGMYRRMLVRRCAGRPARVGWKEPALAGGGTGPASGALYV